MFLVVLWLLHLISLGAFVTQRWLYCMVAEMVLLVH